MKRLTTLISALFLLTLSVSQVWALPDCPKDVSAYWDNCYGSAALNEYGGDYIGDWKDDKRHGQGSLNYFVWGSKTYVKWNGKRLEPGRGYRAKDVETGSYVGGWKDDKRHGHGSERISSFWVRNVESYVGEWKNGMKDGQGIYKSPKSVGFSFAGEWKNGMKDGIGTLTVNKIRMGTQTIHKMKLTCEWRNNRYRSGDSWLTYDRNTIPKFLLMTRRNKSLGMTSNLKMSSCHLFDKEGLPLTKQSIEKMMKWDS